MPRLTKADLDTLRKLCYDDRLDGSEQAILNVLLDRYVALDKAHDRVDNILKEFKWND